MSRRSRRQKGDPTLDASQLDQFCRTLICPTDRVMDELEKELARYGYRTTRGEKYCYAPGDVPVCVVAHVDTVHHSMPVGVAIDSSSTHLRASTATGLGADDRCGVWGVRELLRRGLRPHVLYTDEEETGGHGASEAASAVAPEGVRLLVEMDRMDDDDMVFYSCCSKEAEDYVGQHGFKKAIGSFTDISILMPAWGVAGVNVSIGYYAQHSSGERCNLRVMLRNVNRVGRMLHRPPEALVKYEKQQWAYGGGRGGWPEYDPDYSSWGGSRGVTSTFSEPTTRALEAQGYEQVNGVWQPKAQKRDPSRLGRVLTADEARGLQWRLGLTKKEMMELEDDGSLYVLGGMDAAIKSEEYCTNYCDHCQQYGEPDGGEDPCLECGRGLKK